MRCKLINKWLQKKVLGHWGDFWLQRSKKRKKSYGEFWVFKLIMDLVTENLQEKKKKKTRILDCQSEIKWIVNF